MSEWKNRTTRLVRDDVKVSVMSYPSCFADAWQTIFAVHTEKNLAVCHIGKDWSDANARHNQLVNIAELMGYRVFSEVIDSKEKAPAATLTAPGDKKDLQTQYNTTQGGFTT